MDIHASASSQSIHQRLNVVARTRAKCTSPVFTNANAFLPRDVDQQEKCVRWRETTFVVTVYAVMIKNAKTLKTMRKRTILPSNHIEQLEVRAILVPSPLLILVMLVMITWTTIFVMGTIIGIGTQDSTINVARGLSAMKF